MFQTDPVKRWFKPINVYIIPIPIHVEETIIIDVCTAGCMRGIMNAQTHGFDFNDMILTVVDSAFMLT